MAVQGWYSVQSRHNHFPGGTQMGVHLEHTMLVWALYVPRHITACSRIFKFISMEWQLEKQEVKYNLSKVR